MFIAKDGSTNAMVMCHGFFGAKKYLDASCLGFDEARRSRVPCPMSHLYKNYRIFIFIYIYLYYIETMYVMSYSLWLLGYREPRFQAKNPQV